MIKRIINSIKVVTAAALLAGMTACSSDDILLPDDGNGTSADAQLVISLALPEGAVDGEGASDTRAEMRPTQAEGAIRSLRLVAFGYDGGTAVVNRPLMIPSTMPVRPEKTAIYEIEDVAPGNYMVYLVANLGDALDGVTTESGLRKVLLDYSSRLPEAGNIPMVYEPTAMTSINAAGEGAAQLEATMRMAAVKVRYNIIFDKSFNSDVFGTAGMRLTDVTVSNVAKKSYAVANTSVTDMETRTIKAVGAYFDAYTENQANASVNDRDVLTVSGSGASRPASYTDKWVWQGTLYLPERYVEANGVPTSLNISAVLTDASGADGNVRCRYTTSLAAHDGNRSEKSMPRDTYYEVVAKVKSLGDAELDATVTVRGWTESLLATDFVHTRLQVSKTSASVTSLDSQTISYDTDGRGAVEFECDKTLQDKKPVMATISSTDKTITFSVNPEIRVSELSDSETRGVARCYVKAGNIRKAVEVAYDITPFFTIDHNVQDVQWGDGNAKSKVFTYVTNLGGLLLTANDNFGSVLIGGASSLKSATSTVGSSELSITCADPTAARGTFTVTATKDPVTTTVHYFDAYPADAREFEKFKSLKQDITVNVKPDLGDYRIYFRAINDWQTYDGGYGNQSGEWLEAGNSMDNSVYPVEYYGTAHQNNNWIDYWYCANSNGDSAWGNGRGDRYPHESSHRIYIWTQEGETYGNEDNPRVWRFTDDYIPSENMSQDYNNPGWYYYDLGVNKKQVWHMGGASGDKTPEPGTTLMIFNNHTNAKDPGYTVHRATHHLDPGIPLFDYEDREGWVIYDPTCEPYYRVYDERPYVEDVVYTIYSDSPATGWYKQYGVAEKKASISGSVAQFTVWSNNVQSRSTESINGKTYQVYKIRMKAVRGDYEKAIRINFSGSGSGTVLFNGRAYPGNTGYFNNSTRTWKPGKPQ